MRAEIVVIKRDGTRGEVLPDWSNLEYMDDAIDVGTVLFDYLSDGKREGYLDKDGQEFAILIDGEEPDNSRFLINETDSNDVRDGARKTNKWSGQTLLCRLDEVLVMPRRDEHAREDQVTDAERKAYREAAEEWAIKARKHYRQDVRDAEKQDEQTKQSEDKSPKKKDDYDPMDSYDTDDDGKITWRDFEPGEKMQRSLDQAPPAIGPRFKDATPGEVMLWLLRQGKKRGAIEELHINFTANRDSNGKKWDETITHRFEVGTTALDVARWMYEAGKAECRMQGRRICLFNTDTGKDRKQPRIVLARGKNVTDAPRKGTKRDQATAVFVSSDTGVHGWVLDKNLIRKYGRIEAYLPVQGLKTWDDCETRGRAYLKTYGAPRYQYVFGVVPGAGADPYQQYDIADWIYTLTAGSIERRRVRQIALTWPDSESGATISVSLNNVLLEKSIARDRRDRNQNGKTAGSLGPGFARPSPTPVTAGLTIPKPAPLTIARRASQTEVSHSGLDATGLPLPFDVKHLEIHLLPTADTEPSNATYLDSIRTVGGAKILTGVDYSPNLILRAVAVNDSDDRSEISDPVTTTIIQEIATGPVGEKRIILKDYQSAITGAAGPQTQIKFESDVFGVNLGAFTTGYSSGIASHILQGPVAPGYAGSAGAPEIDMYTDATNSHIDLFADILSLNDIILLNFNNNKFRLGGTTANLINMIRCGVTGITTNVSGQDTIAHGGGVAPDIILCQADATTNAVYVVARSATNFTVELHLASGALLGSGNARNINWLAIWL